MTEQLDTPVLFIIFNRPEYTRRVFEAIRAARPRRLYVAADGPRTEAEKELCEQTRATIQIDWPCELYTNYAEKNLGLKERIPSAIDWFFGQVEEGIILEDDCLPDQSFFQFCHILLGKYKEEKQVYMITGSNPLRGFILSNSYDFIRYYSVWGWATWRRAWQQYDRKMQEWPHHKREGWLASFYSSRKMRKQTIESFDKVYTGQENTWDIQWWYTCLKRGGLCIIPAVNIVSNIGVVGVHSSPGINNNVPLGQIDWTHLRGPDTIAPNATYEQIFFENNFPLPSLSARLNTFVLRTLVTIKRALGL